MTARSKRRLATVLVALAPVLALAAGATAQVGAVETPNDVAAALADDRLYVHPEVAGLVDAGDLRAALDESTTETFIAVMPQALVERAGGINQFLSGLIDQGKPGVYGLAAVAGNGTGELRAGATGDAALSGSEVAPIAKNAADEGTATQVLVSFVGDVDRVAGGPGDGGGSGWVLPVILVVVVVLLLALWGIPRYRRRQRRRALEKARFAEARKLAEEDLVSLGEDIRVLDLDVRMPGADPRAAGAYRTAVECYEKAGWALDRSRRSEDLEPVSGALDEGRYAMVVARAHLEGREPPVRRLPCFFDPRHGPSVEDREWAPPRGAPRDVPVCQACSVDLSSGREPRAREIDVGQRRVPIWEAPHHFGGYFSGYYGSAGTGMLAGFVLADALDSDRVVMAGDAGDAGYGGGDFGGFGGGSFGGGDFGGGDFGGGS